MGRLLDLENRLVDSTPLIVRLFIDLESRLADSTRVRWSLLSSKEVDTVVEGLLIYWNVDDLA